MPEEESVSSLILERIEVIKSAIEDIEKVGCVKDLDTNVDSAWENSKILIDDLHSHTQKLKNEFYKIYDCRIKNVPDPTKEVDNGMPTVDKTLHIDREKNEKSSEKTIEKLKENIGSTSLEKAPTPLKVDKGEESQAIADSKSCENKEKNAESTATVLDSSIGAIQEWQGSDVIDTSIQDSEENPPESKPTIRLVSLSKLIDPKLKSAFTESTPILISSDEESSVVSNGVSKSKKTSSSDKPAKEEKRKTRNSQETKDIRMINKKIETPRKRNSREKNNDRVSSRGSSIQVEGKNKNSTKNSSKKKEAIENCFADGDVKFSYEVYVPLPLVKYEELNAYYCKNKDIFEIKSPNKIMKLQSCKRILRSNNELSKDFEKPSLKKRRISLAFADNNQNSDADQPMNVESSTASDLIKDISQGEEKGEMEEPKLKRSKNADDQKSDNQVATRTKIPNDDIELSDRSDIDENKSKQKNRETARNKNKSKNESKEVTANADSGDEFTTILKSRAEIIRLTKAKMMSSTLLSDNESDADSSDSSIFALELKLSDTEESLEDLKRTKGKMKKAILSDSEQDSDKNDNLDNGTEKPNIKETRCGKKSDKQTIPSNSEKSKCDNGKETENGDAKESSDEENKQTTNKTDVEFDANEDSDKFEKKSDADENTKDSEEEITNRPVKDRKGNVHSIGSEGDNDADKSDSDNVKICESDSDLTDKDKNSSRKKKRLRKAVLSDSDQSNNSKNSDKSSGEDESPDSGSENDEKSKPEKKKKGRRRIKGANNSSSEDEDDNATRKQIRKVLGKDALSETTKQAEADEKERKARIAEKQRKYNQILEEMKQSTVEKLILEYDEEKQQDLLPVHKHFVEKLKPHQASGVRFMWDACFESLKMIKKGSKGGGCVLAHCMGLGKTLQVVTLAHTLLSNRAKTKVDKVMVVCPISTVLNWKNEFKMWMPKRNDVEVFELVSCKNYERQYRVREWHESGGVLIIGYTMFTLLTNPNNKKVNKKLRTALYEGLVDPGPDLVVCDEGHLLKNEKTNLSIAMNRIKTSRRIVLTGTPLQNNLKEYWCMVQFIKPNLLGTYREYLNRFVNPITNGQYTDSTQRDIILMRKRSHVLHKLLDGVVQRRDYAVLAPYLPPKQEYVLFINLSEVQIKIYEEYMAKYAKKNDGSSRTSFLFKDFQFLQKICAHPRTLLDKSRDSKDKLLDDDEEESEGSIKDFIDDGDQNSSSSSSSSSGSSSDSGSDNADDGSEKKAKKKKNHQQKIRLTRAQAAQKIVDGEASEDEIDEINNKEWWQEFCDDEQLENINNSGKLYLLFQILKECEEIGDKILVFSQSLYTLNCIEYFLEKIDEATQNDDVEKFGGHTGSWSLGLDYFRLDGSSSCDNRATWCNMFNNPDNIRARLFLISTRAGGLGINLVAANRVIIFDVSWNPSHDIQSIYRVYRFGQTKPCYIYRFVTYGTMEMKIYERQVTKQAISKRVIDEQQIDRHYNQNDLMELYKCDLKPDERPIPMVPKDVLLGEMLQKFEKIIYKYHEHQSLLENKESEELNEEERKAAWEEFENEKVLRKTETINYSSVHNISSTAPTVTNAITNMVRRDNPQWSEAQVRSIVPSLVKQLQIQLAEGDLVMFNRVQQELMVMQQQQMMIAQFNQARMMQQQQQQNARLGSLAVNPAALAANASMYYPPNLYGNAGPSQRPPSHQLPPSNVIIDLND